MTGKQDKLTAGDGITISDEGVISSSGGEVVLTNENNKLKVQVGENSDTVDVITRYDMTTDLKSGDKRLYVNNKYVNIGGYDYFHVWQGDLKELFQGSYVYNSGNIYPSVFPATDILVQVVYGSTSTATTNATGLIPLYSENNYYETQDILHIGLPKATGTRTCCLGGIYLDTYYTVQASVNVTSSNMSLTDVNVKRGSSNLSKLTGNYLTSTGGGYKVYVRDSYVRYRYGNPLGSVRTGLDTNGTVILDCDWSVDESKASTMTFDVTYSRKFYDDDTYDTTATKWSMSYTDFNKMITGTGYTFSDADSSRPGYGTLKVTVDWGDLSKLCEYKFIIYSSADTGGGTDDNNWNLNRLTVSYAMTPNYIVVTGISGDTPTVSKIRMEVVAGNYGEVYKEVDVVDNNPNGQYSGSMGSMNTIGTQEGRVFKLLDADGNVVAQKTDFTFTRS